MRPGAVNLSAFSVLTSTYNADQVCYSNVRTVRDEQAAGSTWRPYTASPLPEVFVSDDAASPDRLPAMGAVVGSLDEEAGC